MNREYNYEDVYLVPQKCVVESRSECDISVKFGPKRFSNPVIAANMKSVVDYDTCHYLARQGMFYIMHRFGLIRFRLEVFIKESNDEHQFSSISVGVQDEDILLLKYLKEVGAVPSYITIDIAHAHSQRCLDMVKKIKDIFPSCFLIVGNIATAQAIEFFQDADEDSWNHKLVNAFKLNIAPGAACTTKIKTGFTRGTVTCLQECGYVADRPLIADGGIRTPGHIAIALSCGAKMVMAGAFMSGYDENSGQVVEINGHKKYIYYGSASFNNKQSSKHIEGTEVILDYKGGMDDHIYDIECSLRSALSYGGVSKLEDFYHVPMLCIN